MVNAAAPAAVPRNLRRWDWLDICLPMSAPRGGGGGTVAIITGIQDSVQGRRCTVCLTVLGTRQTGSVSRRANPGKVTGFPANSARNPVAVPDLRRGFGGGLPFASGGGEAEGHQAERGGCVADPQGGERGRG